jgi:hypothetical protein
MLDQLAVKKSTGTFTADSMKAASELKKTGKTTHGVYYPSKQSNSLHIAKNISDYITYTLNNDTYQIIMARLNKIFHYNSTLLEFIVQAIDSNGDILTATSQRTSLTMVVFSSYTTIFAPYISYADIRFIDEKFPIEWKDISNEDLAQMKSIKSRMEVK